MAEQTTGLGGYPTIFYIQVADEAEAIANQTGISCSPGGRHIQVADVAEAIAKAVGLGGKKLVGPVTIPTGSFGWIGMGKAAA